MLQQVIDTTHEKAWKEYHPNNMQIEDDIPQLFSDSMEHLPIHLPFEVKVGGPIQYTWMYPFERLVFTYVS
jgi:hypothetical protein